MITWSTRRSFTAVSISETSSSSSFSSTSFSTVVADSNGGTTVQSAAWASAIEVNGVYSSQSFQSGLLNATQTTGTGFSSSGASANTVTSSSTAEGDTAAGTTGKTFLSGGTSRQSVKPLFDTSEHISTATASGSTATTGNLTATRPQQTSTTETFINVRNDHTSSIHVFRGEYTTTAATITVTVGTETSESTVESTAQIFESSFTSIASQSSTYTSTRIAVTTQTESYTHQIGTNAITDVADTIYLANTKIETLYYFNESSDSWRGITAADLTSRFTLSWYSVITELTDPTRSSVTSTFSQDEITSRRMGFDFTLRAVEAWFGGLPDNTWNAGQAVGVLIPTFTTDTVQSSLPSSTYTTLLPPTETATITEEVIVTYTSLIPIGIGDTTTSVSSNVGSINKSFTETRYQNYYGANSLTSSTSGADGGGQSSSFFAGEQNFSITTFTDTPTPGRYAVLPSYWTFAMDTQNATPPSTNLTNGVQGHGLTGVAGVTIPGFSYGDVQTRVKTPFPFPTYTVLVSQIATSSTSFDPDFDFDTVSYSFLSEVPEPWTNVSLSFSTDGLIFSTMMTSNSSTSSSWTNSMRLGTSIASHSIWIGQIASTIVIGGAVHPGRRITQICPPGYRVAQYSAGTSEFSSTGMYTSEFDVGTGVTVLSYFPIVYGPFADAVGAAFTY